MAKIIEIMFISICLQKTDVSQYKQFLVKKICSAKDEHKSSATSFCLMTGY